MRPLRQSFEPAVAIAGQPGVNALAGNSKLELTSPTLSPANTASTARHLCSTLDKSSNANLGSRPHDARKHHMIDQPTHGTGQTATGRREVKQLPGHDNFVCALSKYPTAVSVKLWRMGVYRWGRAKADASTCL
jgi:hypothetical protein